MWAHSTIFMVVVYGTRWQKATSKPDLHLKNACAVSYVILLMIPGNLASQLDTLSSGPDLHPKPDLHLNQQNRIHIMNI